MPRSIRQAMAFAVFIILSATIGCPSTSTKVTNQSPELSYRAIEADFVSGDLATAQQLAETALRRSQGLDPAWDTRLRIELAKVYLYQGQNEKVETLLQQPFPANLNRDDRVRKDLLLAVAEIRLGHEQLSHDALARVEISHPMNELHAEFVGTQGSVALAEIKLEECQILSQAALEEDERLGATFHAMQMWMNLGVAALKLEHYEDALVRFRHASTLAQMIGARQASAKALGNLGWTYYQTGDFQLAQQSAEAAYKQAESLGSTLDEVRLLTNIGMSQFRTGNRAAARASYERALKLAEGLHLYDEMLGTHITLASLLLHELPDVSREHIRQADQLATALHDTASQLELSLLKCLLLADMGKSQEAAQDLLKLGIQTHALPSLRWEAEHTLATIYAKDGKDRDSELWFQRAIATFHQQRLTLKSAELQLPFLENGNDLYLGYMEHLIHEGRTDEALAVLDSSRAEALAEGLGTSSATSAKLQKSAPSARALAARLHATILVYCLRPQTSYLWAINPAGTNFYKLPGSTAILPLVARQTQAILTSKDLLTQKDDTGQQLYNALVKPAESSIGLGSQERHGNRVFLIADKGLGGLNFETLVAPGVKPHYWIEDVTLTNARSLRLLAASKQAAAGPRKLLLVGDPLYQPEEFPALPNAAAEMTSVAAHFTPDTRTIAAGPNASPTTYTADGPGKFAYIHFVAHATANETNPLDSAIILSTPPGTPANHPAANRLYARDILQKPLGADLVTISSCYGSGTRNYSGEGVVGLVWAFLRAGAHSVIGASWEVSDVSTPQLMDALYTRLLSGDQPDEALRSGKLAMIRGNGIYRKPLYWAAFQLYTGR